MKSSNTDCYSKNHEIRKTNIIIFLDEGWNYGYVGQMCKDHNKLLYVLFDTIREISNGS